MSYVNEEGTTSFNNIQTPVPETDNQTWFLTIGQRSRFHSNCIYKRHNEPELLNLKVVSPKELK